MSAADYYGPGVRPTPVQHPSFLAPPQPQRASSNPHIIFNQQQSGSPQRHSPHLQPQYAPPPPYQPLNESSKPNVRFAPTPSPLHEQRHSFSNGQRPDPRYWNQPSPQQWQPQPHPAHQQQLAPYNPQQYIPQNGSLPAPHMRPYMQANPSERSFDGGYSSDPESHRRRHKHGDEHKRRISETSRSSNADGFIGAAGGGLIGDLIFPGLGTVGGALIGYFGGKDYGKHRKWREDKRDRDQTRWEKEYGHREGRSHSRDRRKSSHDRYD